MKRLALACRDAWMKAMYVSNAVWLSSESLTQIVFSLLYIAGVYWLGGKMVSFGVILAMASLCEPLLAAHHQSGEHLQLFCE